VISDDERHRLDFLLRELVEKSLVREFSRDEFRSQSAVSRTHSRREQTPPVPHFRDRLVAGLPALREGIQAADVVEKRARNENVLLGRTSSVEGELPSEAETEARGPLDVSHAPFGEVGSVGGHEKRR